MSDMPLLEIPKELKEIRRTLHAMPELGCKEYKTAAFVADSLARLGLKVTEGIAGTGVVATLRRGDHPFRLGLRADMDALPMFESGNRSYASHHQGVMHGCGHDGHMTMLLGAARALVEDKDFAGTVHFIFQPAEESIGGARLMLKDGLFDKFPCDMIFGLHNMPGIPTGHFAGKTGALMSSIDAVKLTVQGRGGHGAHPEDTIDPILIGSQIVCSLQTIISRTLSPLEKGVITVGTFQAGSACNIIPDQASLEISIRAAAPPVREQMIRRIETLSSSIAQGFGGSVSFDWQQGYPVLVNHDTPFRIARQIITETFGPEAMQDMVDPIMSSEDFSFLLEETPGAFLLIGNGDTPPLHNTSYDFNDEVIPYGVRFYHELARYIFSR